jgi:predicted transcriptional regulator
LSKADLRGARLRGTNFTQANLKKANLSEADLTRANLVKTNLKDAVLVNCRIYGISAWNVQLEEAVRLNLTITPTNEPAITIDNLKVAQFIYLLLNNEEIREAINTLTMKVVLILGRFTPERKAILDAIRDELRKQNYLPVLFDFEKPASRDITETISTLAHMARFVIADITDAKSISQELDRIVPDLPSVPVQPLLQMADREYGMFEHFTRYPWVLPIYHYTDQESLLQSLKASVIDSAEQKAQELTKHEYKE